jgi:hypothetical protein
LRKEGASEEEIQMISEALSGVETVEQLSMVMSMMTAKMSGDQNPFELLMMEITMMFAADGQKPEESELPAIKEFTLQFL